MKGFFPCRFIVKIIGLHPKERYLSERLNIWRMGPLREPEIRNFFRRPVSFAMPVIVSTRRLDGYSIERSKMNFPSSKPERQLKVVILEAPGIHWILIRIHTGIIQARPIMGRNLVLRQPGRPRPSMLWVRPFDCLMQSQTD